MAKQFEPVKIIGLDVAASRPSGQGALQDVVLNLSVTVGYEWGSLFNQLWSQHFYMMKRHAEASGKRLTVTCMPDELDGGLLAELKKVAAETNTAFKAAVDQANAKEAQQQAQVAAEKQSLAQLANKLDFD